MTEPKPRLSVDWERLIKITYAVLLLAAVVLF